MSMPIGGNLMQIGKDSRPTFVEGSKMCCSGCGSWARRGIKLPFLGAWGRDIEVTHQVEGEKMGSGRRLQGVGQNARFQNCKLNSRQVFIVSVEGN